MGVFQQPANLQEELWRGEPEKIGGKVALRIIAGNRMQHFKIMG